MLNTIHKKIVSKGSPGIIYEDVYYFDGLERKSKDSFCMGVWMDQVVRVEPRHKQMLNRSLEEVRELFEKRKFSIHKI